MKTRKVLVAVDGSTYSLAAIRYIAETVKPDRVALHLLHVMCPRTENFWDEEIDSASADTDQAIQDWEKIQRCRMEAFTTDARKMVCDAGISEDAISVDIKRRERGVARDIFREAQRGYDALVLGRHGANPEEGLLIGGVANKIAHVLHHFPVWIVTESRHPSCSVLVALDGSEGARRALDHAADMIGPQCSTICLFHAIRGGPSVAAAPDKGVPRGGSRLEALAQERIPKAERAMKDRMKRWAEHLAERMEGSPRIVTRIVAGVPSRAGAVMQEVDAGGYSTVVLGRRGLSQEREFAMGRVCAKVLQMAQQTTVWIVN